MRVEPLDASHLPEIRRWRVERGEGDLPEGVLPPAGFVACDGRGPAAVAWSYYPEGVPLAIVDWLVSRPGLRQAEARQAARWVFAAAVAAARERGITRVFITACREGMVREAESCGFTVVAREATHLMRNI